ncbi:MAG: glycosyltransferase family 4 protein [Bacteroidetes bacterium]|nr:glycosyltransferase family 4 protein [Bacteroidota bacterium]
MNRILIITYYWPPSGGAGVQRWVKLSRYFAKKGVKVFVVTVDPKKASYALLDETLQHDVDPSVKVFHTSTFEPYGIYKTITGKKQIPFGGFANEDKRQLKFSQKVTRFIRGNAFLPDARVGWNKYAFAECCRIIEEEKIDAVITTSPPHSTQLTGLKLKKKFGIKWLADLRDQWTDIYYYDKLYLTDYSRKRDAEMEREVLEQADAVVTVSEEIRKKLISKSKELNPDKFFVIPNGFDAEDFKNQKQQQNSHFIISYTGTLTDDYRIEKFLSAVRSLEGECPEMMLHITGSFPGGIKTAIQNAAKEKVKFLPHVPHHEAVKQMCSGDLLLLVIPDAKGNKGILTGKLFEYLATQKTILCIGPEDGDAAGIISSCGAGMTFDYENENGMKKFILEKYSEWKLKGKTSGADHEAIKKFSREEQAGELLKVLGSL